MRIKFGVITICIVVIVAFCVKGTVLGNNRDIRVHDNKYYQQMEEEFVESVKSELYELGYTNCGVMMTRVADESGMREYTVMIHHSRLAKANTQIQMEVLNSLTGYEFDQSKCSFTYEI